MKSRVNLSLYSTVVTVVVTLLLFGICVAIFSRIVAFITVLSLTLILIITSLFFAPVSISANSKFITVKSIFRKRHINLEDIESIRLFQPSMGAYRLFGSGGYFGYWGLFREGDIGKYMAYYGKASDCFLVKLRNGDQYVLGCQQPEEMVNYIKERMPAGNN